MSIIGCDLHTRYQVVAWIDEETGEIRVRRLEHEGEEVRKGVAQSPWFWDSAALLRLEPYVPC